VVTPDVGGGFGMKLFLYPEHVLVLWAAKRLGRPLKWVPDRSESFVSDTQGRDNIVKLDLALDEGLRFLGLSVELIANMGAYLSNFAPEIPTGSGGVMYSGVYAFPAIHVAVQGVYTHTVPVDAYRGAGRPEASYLVERMIDAEKSNLYDDGRQLPNLPVSRGLRLRCCLSIHPCTRSFDVLRCPSFWPSAISLGQRPFTKTSTN